MKLFEELCRRGAIAQFTNKEGIEELINNGKAIFYMGCDATANSLHVGHFLQLVLIKRLINGGNKPVILLGTGTTLVGDPTGKTDMRKMLSKEEIDYNADCFQQQISKYFGLKEATFVRNGDWLCKLKYLELLREIGTYFSVNAMLTAECFKSRMERGLSFLEFNYMIMQSYDFLHLNKEYGCNLEIGGDDQWSNILGGVKLVKKALNKEVFGMTFKLLTTPEGKKMGKTEKGALWLDEDKMPVYDFYQFWRNIDDQKVFECLKLLTFISIEELEEMERSNININQAKELLAFEVTKLVHGEEKAKQAEKTAKAIFTGNMDIETMPCVELKDVDFNEADEIELTVILTKSGVTKSKSEARRLIEQNSIILNGEKITDVNRKIFKGDLKNTSLVLQKGKKTFLRIMYREI